MPVIRTYTNENGVICSETRDKIFIQDLIEGCEGLTDSDTEEKQLQTDKNLTKLLRRLKNGRTKK